MSTGQTDLLLFWKRNVQLRKPSDWHKTFLASNNSSLPALARDVDFSIPITFLDKELEQLAQTSLKGAKQVDKLAQVALRDGSEQWILVHIEVQGDKDDDFSLRMFRYFYRIFDRHGQRVVSIAILTGTESLPSEGRYELTAYGSGVDFRYLPFRLMEYDRVELERDDNPAALVVLAMSHLSVGAEAVTIAFQPSWTLAALGLAVAGAVGFLAGVAPGWHAARAEIVAALRA